MEKNMKTVLLKDHNTNKDKVVCGESWEELYDNICNVAEHTNISTDYLPGTNPTIAMYYYEDTGKYGVVICGKDLEVSFEPEVATLIFAAFVVKELKEKE